MPPHPDVLLLAESILEDVRSGVITGIAVALTVRGGAPSVEYNEGYEKRHDVLGAVALLQARVARDMLDPEDDPDVPSSPTPGSEPA